MTAADDVIQLAGTATALLGVLRAFLEFGCEACERGVLKGSSAAKPFEYCECAAGHAAAVLEEHKLAVDLYQAQLSATARAAIRGYLDAIDQHFLEGAEIDIDLIVQQAVASVEIAPAEVSS